MGIIQYEDNDKFVGTLTECETDGKGNVLERTYQDNQLYESFWEKASRNIARTLQEILIQRPELIPVFAELAQQEPDEFADQLDLPIYEQTKT